MCCTHAHTDTLTSTENSHHGTDSNFFSVNNWARPLAKGESFHSRVVLFVPCPSLASPCSNSSQCFLQDHKERGHAPQLPHVAWHLAQAPLLRPLQRGPLHCEWLPCVHHAMEQGEARGCSDFRWKQFLRKASVQGCSSCRAH